MSITYGSQNGSQQTGAPQQQPQATAPAPPQVGVPPQMPQQYMIQGYQPPVAPQAGDQAVMPLPPTQTGQQQIQQNYGTAQGYSIQPNYHVPQNAVQPNVPPPMPQAQLQHGYQAPQQQPMQVGNPGAMQMQSVQAPPQASPAVNLQAPPANIHTVRNQQDMAPQNVGTAPTTPPAFVAGLKRRQQVQTQVQGQAPQQQQEAQQQQAVQQQAVHQQVPQQQQVQQQAAHQEAPHSPFSEPAPTVGDIQHSAETLAGPDISSETPETIGNVSEESQQKPQGGVPISHSGQLEGVGDKSNNWMQAPLGSREEVEVPRPVFGVQYGQQLAKIDPEDGKYKVVYDPYTRRGAVGNSTGVAQQPTYGIGKVHSNNIHKAYQNREARRVSGALPFGAKYTNPQQIPTQTSLKGYTAH